MSNYDADVAGYDEYGVTSETPRLTKLSLRVLIFLGYQLYRH